MTEHRGVRCLDCINVDLKRYPAEAKCGWSTCKAIDSGPLRVFQRMAMSRNCTAYDPAPPETVAARDAWAKTIKLPAWQR